MTGGNGRLRRRGNREGVVKDFLEIITGAKRIDPARGVTYLVLQKGSFILQSALDELPGHPLQQSAVDNPGERHQRDPRR